MMKRAMRLIICAVFMASLMLGPTGALAASGVQANTINAQVYQAGRRVTGVSLNKTTLSLDQGKTYQLKVTVKPSNAANKKVTWKSGNTKIATVSSKGVVKGIKAGTAYIYVTTADGKKSAKCKVIVKRVEKRGSTTGNSVNGGLAQKYGDWIYYACWNESIHYWELKKIKTDGTGKTKLANVNGYSINIVDGWIYGGDGPDLYKMRTDGTGKKVLDSDGSLHISVVDGWIYYFNDDYYHSNLYKIRTDGTGKKKLYGGYALDINVTGGWVYFTVIDGVEDNWHYSLYKMRTDGTGKKKILNTNPFCVNVVDGWVYYINYYKYDYDHSAMYGPVYKMRTDGTGKTKISNLAYDINVQGGWVYYTDKSNLCKMRTDGTGIKKLVRVNTGSHMINIAGDWIYYFVNSSIDDMRINRIRMDGTGNQLVN
jgi:hypothetical protein